MQHKALLVGYKVIVRSLLEYACQVWKLNEWTVMLQDGLSEGKTSNEDQMKSLKLPSLAKRRPFCCEH